MHWTPAQIQAFFTGLGVFLAAVVTAYIRLRAVLKEIHVMVNSNLTDALTRIAALQAVVQAQAPIVVQPVPAVPAPGPEP